MTKRKRIEHPWYNYDRINSFNGVFNFVVGERGNGKTYGAKKQAIKKFLRTGDQFIYLRRYTTELATRETFFADIGDEFPDHDFRVFGHQAQMSPVSARSDKKRHWQVMGYFVALTKSQAQKSMSYHRVTTIIFDEFILEKSVLRYLPEEVTIFLNFYSTVDRNQDKTRVYFLANSVSMMNPYFLEYEIRPDELPPLSVHRDGFIVVHFINSADFAKSVYQTRFGKFIQDTEYAKYAVENQFSDAHQELLKPKTERAKYMYTLETKKGMFSIWYDGMVGEYFAQQKRPKSEQIMTLMPERMSDKKTLTSTSGNLMSALRTAFRHGRLSFDSPVTRNQFVEVFKQ